MEDRKVKLVFWFCFEDAIRRNWREYQVGAWKHPCLQDCRAEGAICRRMWLRWSRISLQYSRVGFDPLQYSESDTTMGGESTPSKTAELKGLSLRELKDQVNHIKLHVPGREIEKPYGIAQGSKLKVNKHKTTTKTQYNI